MLFCAGISGRYYTDFHDVDEDKTTIAAYGGFWNEDRRTGLYRTSMNGWVNKDHSVIDVASRLIYLS